MRREPASRLALIGALAIIAGAGCAHRMGERGAAGAISGLRQATEEAANTPPDQQLSRMLAQRAMQGAIGALDTPEEQARIQRIVATAVEAATRTAIDSATSQLIAQLGPNGDGPLGRSLTHTGQQVSNAIVASMVGGVGDQLSALAPDCQGEGRLACLQSRMHDMARSTASGFAAGVKDSFRWQVPFLAFAGGALAGILGAWLWSLRHQRARRFQAA